MFTLFSSNQIMYLALLFPVSVRKKSTDVEKTLHHTLQKLRYTAATQLRRAQLVTHSFIYLCTMNSRQTETIKYKSGDRENSSQ